MDEPLFTRRSLIKHQIGIDFGLAPHLHIIGIFSTVGVGHLGSRFHIFIFGIEAFELPIFLGSGTGHIKFSIFRAQKIPAMHIIHITVAIVISPVELFFCIGPQHRLQRTAIYINTRIDNTHHHLLPEFGMPQLQIVLRCRDMGTFQTVVPLLIPAGIRIIGRRLRQCYRSREQQYAAEQVSLRFQIIHSSSSSLFCI